MSPDAERDALRHARRSRGADWSFILLLGCASGLSAFGMASVIPALPAIGQSLAAPTAQLQFVVSGYLLGLGLFQPMQGLLCDRFGRRPVLLTGFGIFVVASLLASTTHSLFALCAARVFQSFGVSVATVIPRAMVRDTHEPEAAAVAMSFISAVMGISPIVAPAAGGIVADAYGWNAVFQMHALMGSLLLVLMFWQLRETRPAETRAMGIGQLFAGFGVLLKERSFVAFATTYGFTSAASFMFITVGATVFGRLFAMTPAHFGAFWAMLAIGYMGGSICAGWAARRFGAEQVVRGGTVMGIVGAVGVLVAGLMPEASLTVWSVALIVLLFANGLSAPLSLAGAVSSHADLAGIASGLSSSLAMLMSMFGAIASGLVFRGDPTPNAILMLLCAVAAWFTARAAYSKEQ